MNAERPKKLIANNANAEDECESKRQDESDAMMIRRGRRILYRLFLGPTGLSSRKKDLELPPRLPGGPEMKR